MKFRLPTVFLFLVMFAFAPLVQTEAAPSSIDPIEKAELILTDVGDVTTFTLTADHLYSPAPYIVQAGDNLEYRFIERFGDVDNEKPNSIQPGKSNYDYNLISSDLNRFSKNEIPLAKYRYSIFWRT